MSITADIEQMCYVAPDSDDWPDYAAFVFSGARHDT